MADGPSDATTVIIADPISQNMSRGKNVAFDINRSPIPPLSLGSPSFGLMPKSILHRQGHPSAPMKKPSSLSISALRGYSDLSKKIDLVHDDWYGMAPLASPETLSEISSISSRASLVNNLASSIEKYLQRVSLYGKSGPSQYDSECNGVIDESQLHTPRVMRRTPKITGNLSTCADDWRSVDSYKRMGHVFLTNPRVPSQSDSSGEHSYESASSLSNKGCDEPLYTSQRIFENSKSAENLDDDKPSEFLSATKLTMSDSAILNECLSQCPKCPCKSRTSMMVECCKKYDHTQCSLSKPSQQVMATNTNSSSDTYHSAMSSITTLESKFSPQSSTKPIQGTNSFKKIPEEYIRTGVLESHFPVYTTTMDQTDSSDKSSLLPNSPSKPKPTDKRLIAVMRKRNGSQDSNVSSSSSTGGSGGGGFTRNESLPLLAGLSERCSPTNFVKRKKYVYPMSPVPSTHKGESSV